MNGPNQVFHDDDDDDDADDDDDDVGVGIFAVARQKKTKFSVTSTSSCSQRAWFLQPKIISHSGDVSLFRLIDCDVW